MLAHNGDLMRVAFRLNAVVAWPPVRVNDRPGRDALFHKRVQTGLIPKRGTLLALKNSEFSR